MATSIGIEPSVGDLRRRAESNRARLTDTVEELRTQVSDTATDIKERLSPAAIKAEVSDYVRDSGTQLWDTMQKRAHDNPLQAVAIGAAVAYPALKLLRAMPAPLLLIGAGLFLSRSSARPPEALRNVADAVRSKAEEAVERASSALEEASDTARRSFHDAKDVVHGGVDAVIDRASGAVDALRDRAASGTESAKATVAETANSIQSQTEAMVEKARQTVSTTWDQNPLLVAGIGLAIGAVLAAAFPTTSAEQTVFGDANNALQRKAGEVVGKGVDAAKDVVDNVARVAGDQGLSPEGITHLGETLNDKLRAVADRGMAAALNEPPPSTTAPSISPIRDQQS